MGKDTKGNRARFSRFTTEPFLNTRVFQVRDESYYFTYLHRIDIISIDLGWKY